MEFLYKIKWSRRSKGKEHRKKGSWGKIKNGNSKKMSEKNKVLSGKWHSPFLFSFIWIIINKHLRRLKGKQKKIIKAGDDKKKNKWLKVEQYELPEEAAGLSVVLTVRYICEEINQKLNKNNLISS